MNTQVSIINVALATALPATVVVASVTMFGVEVEILTIVSVLTAMLMSIFTRIFVNMRSKNPISWKENMLLGTITTVLSVGVVQEYHLPFLFAGAAGIAISATGEAIIAALGQGALDIVKDSIAAVKGRVSGLLAPKSPVQAPNALPAPAVVPALPAPSQGSADTPDSPDVEESQKSPEV